MSRLSIPIAEHNKIRNSPEVQAALLKLAGQIAAEAGSMCGDPEGYGHGDLTVNADRSRAHVWAKSGAARKAEAKSSPLMQIAASKGGNR
jgi:hypothetical protein